MNWSRYMSDLIRKTGQLCVKASRKHEKGGNAYVLRGQPTLNMFLAKPYRVTSYILLWFTLYTTYHISF